jgi:hypothetical protein
VCSNCNHSIGAFANFLSQVVVVCYSLLFSIYKVFAADFNVLRISRRFRELDILALGLDLKFSGDYSGFVA